jgi:hypothetical protein
MTWLQHVIQAADTHAWNGHGPDQNNAAANGKSPHRPLDPTVNDMPMNVTSQSSFRLDGLSSEVTAGFLQLLVPILRETHGIPLRVQKRETVHVVSDLMLQVVGRGHDNTSNRQNMCTSEEDSRCDHT